ncbi:MAG: uL15 family ribosomal protein [Candidatus Diapherotrites archaeon]
MTIRRERKKHRMRGNRTHGHGNTKNRRGSGIRGGQGRAGSHKHKFSKYYADFGVKITLKPKFAGGETVNLDFVQKNLQKWVAEKKVEEKDEVFELDGKKLGIRKILSSGKIEEAIALKGIQVSAKAREKIEEAGGEVQ